MAFSRTAPRHDITYLRRRPKVGETPTPPAATAGPSLSLRRGAEPTRATTSVRRAHGRTVLSRDVPAVTLDRRQSAMGSLAFDLVGAGELSCAWELEDGESGLVAATAGTLVSPQFGRRAIVQLIDGRVVIGLRHVRRLRRLLLLASGLSEDSPSRLIGDLLDGGTIESAHARTRSVTAALAIYQVAGELVARREDFGLDTLEKAAAAYGFALTWLPPVQR